MKVKFYTNIVFGGWSPKDYATGIGGSEEKLIEFARHLAKSHDVVVYMNGEHGLFDGVSYEPHNKFVPYEYCDVFISFKAAHILDLSINAGKIIHLTTEVEPQWPKSRVDSVDRISTISNFHKSRMGQQDKVFTDYLWVDLEELDDSHVRKQKGTMLYSSSFDRGLEELLVNWGKVKEALNVDTLFITYGWEFLDKIIRTNPQMAAWKSRMEQLMDQDGIKMLGRLPRKDMNELYWLSEYWCLPLNNPNSELFCLNAAKAQHCGSIPVVRRIGALQETVNEFIDWDNLMGQKVSKSNLNEATIKNNQLYVKQFDMTTIMDLWEKTISSI